jgi:Leucine-rich repeat (LRR) protein
MKIHNLSELEALTENQLWSVTDIDLSNSEELEEIPQRVFLCPHVQRINVSGNWISSIPDNILNLSSLITINLRDNNFSEIPRVLFLHNTICDIKFSQDIFTADDVAHLLHLGSISRKEVTIRNNN